MHTKEPLTTALVACSCTIGDRRPGDQTETFKSLIGCENSYRNTFSLLGKTEGPEDMKFH